VFQPAEETLEGARAMIDDGVLDRFPPREVYALHCGPLPVGVIAALPGVGLPGLDSCHLEFSGPGAAETGRRFLDRVGELVTVTRPRSEDDYAALLGALQTQDGPLARYLVQVYP
jgi:metal-dependent amidase/aminoacylase/carboxypeptidase family protein